MKNENTFVKNRIWQYGHTVGFFFLCGRVVIDTIKFQVCSIIIDFYHRTKTLFCQLKTETHVRNTVF